MNPPQIIHTDNFEDFVRRSGGRFTGPDTSLIKDNVYTFNNGFKAIWWKPGSTYSHFLKTRTES